MDDGSSLRRRVANQGRSPPTSIRTDEDDSKDTKLAKTLRKFDVYARVDEDLTVRTESGATVTVVFWVLLLLLIASEVRSYVVSLSGQKEHLRVDTTLGKKLDINLNMTFHAINCLDLHVDAMDVAGDNQIDVEHHMLKQRLTKDGAPLADAISEEISALKHRATLPKDYCGSCYGTDDRGKAAATAELAARSSHSSQQHSGSGAVTTTLQCCNTCHEVTESFALRGWSTADLKTTAEQCIREAHLTVPLQEGEGCRLSGQMRVNKVAGNFHMAMGESMVKDGRHVHIFNIDDSDTFNIRYDGD
eukprot:18812-Heterococcus_DN1.PRE.3